MIIEKIPIKDINIAYYNPRKDLQPGDPEYEKLKKSILEFDLVEPLVWNKRTQRLVGGHQRLKILKERGDSEVEVSVVDLDEVKEKALNLVLNKVTGEWDPPALKDLLEELDTGILDDIEITGFDDKEIEELMTQFHVEKKEDEIVEETIPIFPSDNEYGIPVLDLSMQANSILYPVVTWGSQSRAKRMDGTWNFYCDDYRFNHIWDEPEQIIRTASSMAIEPNFSCYENMPKVVGLYRVFQKRWVSRYWQNNNIRIIVDLNVSLDFYDLNLLGVPKGWKAFATRGYAERLEDLQNEHEIACCVYGGSDPIFLVYGGGKKVQEVCLKKKFIWIEDFMARRRGNG